MGNNATLVVTATPNPEQMESVQRYLKGVLPLLLGAGGQLVKRLKVSEAVRGQISGMVLVMDFETEEDIKQLFDSKEYSKLVPDRDKGFSAMDIMIASELA
jgi:uncharacterized protein (DUF1330 family)